MQKKESEWKRFGPVGNRSPDLWLTAPGHIPLSLHCCGNAGLSSLNRHTRRFNPRAWPFTWFNSRTRQEAYLFSWKTKLPKRFPDLIQLRFSLWRHTLFSSSILQELDYDRSPDLSFTSPGRIPLLHHCYGNAGYELAK